MTNPVPPSTSSPSAPAPQPPTDPNANTPTKTPTDTSKKQDTKVFVYAPDVQVYIGTKNGVVDVSDDVIKGQVQRVENSVSQCAFTLNNAKGQYSLNGENVISRMDKIIVYMTKIKRIKVFSGYIDSAPFLDLYPTTCDITASCTLKRLLFTYWDPGLTASQTILDQNTYKTDANADVKSANNPDPKAGGTTASNPNPNTQPGQPSTTGAADPKTAPQNNQNKTPAVADAGLGAMLAALLVKVGGWKAEDVHIQKFPTDFMKFAIATSQDPAKYASAIKDMQTLLGITGDASGGVGDISGAFTGNIPQTPGTFGGVALNAKQLKYADIIAGVGKSMGMDKKGIVIGLATAMRESQLGMIGMTVATDHDSLGLFQQRPSVGEWGTAAQCMDPVHSSQAFFGALKKINYAGMRETDAAAQVQRPRADLRGAYQQYVPMAAALVNAAGAGATSTPAAPAPAASTTPAPTAPAAPAATPAGQKPADKAIAYAMSKVGRMYVWGGKGPDNFDCSGLTWCAWKEGGKDIGSSTTAQLAQGGPHIPGGNEVSQPGDLWFPSTHVDHPGGHVALVIGPNMVVEAPEEGKPIHTTSMYSPPFAIVRADQAPGSAVAGGDQSATSSGSTIPPYVYGLFNVMFQTNAFFDSMSDLLKGEIRLINDEQLMVKIQAVAKAGLRSFQSGPDGSFIAYYPDYFGIHNGPAMKLEDIEMKDVKIQISDGPMATHVYAIGNTQNGGYAQPDTYLAYTGTQGVATVENADLFKMMINIDPKNAPDFTADEIMKRFGARPMTNNLPMIGSQSLERFQAIILFMTKWAEQYQTTIQLTFMPELWPGMRIQLASHSLVVYVKAVSHSIDRQRGFTTSVQIMAPSTVAGDAGINGLPIAHTDADTNTTTPATSTVKK